MSLYAPVVGCGAFSWIDVPVVDHCKRERSGEEKRFGRIRKNGRPAMPPLDHPTTTLLLILVPLLVTELGQRLYLHLVNPDADVYIAGYNVHHLYTGALIEIPAAFVLAFGGMAPAVRAGALVALGVGSAMVLDQVVYLITTDGSNRSYLTPVSLWGAVVLEGLAVVLLLVLWALAG